MTQEEKQLLLTDLCARLPYGVKVENTTFSEPQIQTLFGRISDNEFLMLETYKSVGGEDYRRVTDDVHYSGYLVNIKPYLRSMSSMTEEEEDKYRAINCYEGLFPCNEDALDYALSHHLDFRGLIPMGIAMEAPEGMYN